MKGRRALRRRRARARGFTLIELMVVVVLVAVIAALASPSMAQARNDRICFDYARQYQQQIQRARSRAAGTGAAHLAVIGRGTDDRGYIRIYAALDGQPTAPLNLIGPNPVSSCKGASQWVDAATEPVVLTSTTARFVDATDMNGAGGVNDNMKIRADVSGTGLNTAATLAINGFIVICVTPAGTTFAGGGDTALHAIDAMRDAPTFTGIAEIDIQRHDASMNPVGQKRRVIVTGGGAPRIKSE